MNTTATQDQLLTDAQRLIEGFITSRGAFEAFALAKQMDGSISAVQPAGGAGFTEVLHTLMRMAQAGEITAVAIGTPAEDGGNKMAIIDVESKGEGRLLTVLPFSKRLFGGWKFGPKEQQRQPNKLFGD